MTFQSAATSIASAIRPSLRPFTHLSTRWGWRLRCRLCRAGEKIGHFGVAHLMEIAIVEANCSQHIGDFEADGLVGLLAQLGKCLRRRYRDGEPRCAGLRRRSERNATRIVAPVAMPSSTTIAARPVIAIGGRPAQ